MKIQNQINLKSFSSQDGFIFNYQKFSGDCDLQDVYDAVLQFPMMSDKKFVLLTDYDFESAAKSDFEKLCTILAEAPDSCVFVLFIFTIMW